MDKGWAELGQAIRRHRRAAGLSQERLAERSGLHWTSLSEIEASKVNPTVNVLRRIADAPGARASQQLAETEDADKE